MGVARRTVITVLVALAIAACGGGSDPGIPADLVIVSGDGQLAQPGALLQDSLVVRLVEGNGKGVAGEVVAWAASGGGGVVAPDPAPTDGAGRAAASWALGPGAGPNTATAGAAGFTAHFTATASGSAPSRLALTTQPVNGQSGVVFGVQPVVQVQDPNGVPLPQQGTVVTATIASGPSFSSLGGTATATTNGAGAASFTDLQLRGPVGNYTLRFSAPSLTAVTSSAVLLGSASGRIPLTDMGATFSYLGQFSGGLFANGSNTVPAAHATAGAARARTVQPLDVNGTPSPGGTIVLMSVGLSNTTQEWCDIGHNPACNSWTFTGQALADPAVDHAAVTILDGAKGSQTAVTWDQPTDFNYDRVRDSLLIPRGFSENQVQVIWLKLSNEQPSVSLPSASADAIALLTSLGNIVRSVRVRYPNLQIVFISSRIYAGYANTTLNPEPYAFEAGFAVKWVIQAQIDQMANGGVLVDSRAGNLNYTTGAAPWITWGPYLWADGLNPRSDGLTWTVSEFESDGTHPAQNAETKIGTILLTFFKTDPRAACWFLAGQTCP